MQEQLLNHSNNIDMEERLAPVTITTSAGVAEIEDPSAGRALPRRSRGGRRRNNNNNNNQPRSQQQQRWVKADDGTNEDSQQLSSSDEHPFQRRAEGDDSRRSSIGLPLLSISHNNQDYELFHFFQAPPNPEPACTLPLPEEEEQLQRKNAHTMHQDDRVPDQKEAGFVPWISTVFGNLVHSVERTVDACTESINDFSNNTMHNSALSRLRAHFPQYADERLVGEYRCKLATRNGALSGYLQCTTSTLLFIQDIGTSIAVPLNEILCIQRLRPSLSDSLHPPQFTAVTCLSATAIQFFLTSGQLLIFKDFSSLRLSPNTIVRNCYVVCDHMWRSCCEVPNPNWRFVDSDQFLQPDVAELPLGKKIEEGGRYTPPPMQSA